MKLNNRDLYDLLKEKGITRLYHSNTVSTSITFFEQSGLLSRGYIEDRDLFQSFQSSDEIDKKFNVWNDVFLDTVDLHGHFPRQNFYGPISFQFSIELLLSSDYDIWITKDNPTHWNDNMSDCDKYFESVEELKDKWDLFLLHRKMITIRNPESPILFNYLLRCVVDYTIVNRGGFEYFRECAVALKRAVHNTQCKNKLELRKCDKEECYCEHNYLYEVEISDLKRLFLPSDKQ